MASTADTLRLLRLAMWLLLSAGLLVLAVPIPVPVRLATASVDLIAAAVVWLALRQRREK